MYKRLFRCITMFLICFLAFSKGVMAANIPSDAYEWEGHSYALYTGEKSIFEAKEK